MSRILSLSAVEIEAENLLGPDPDQFKPDAIPFTDLPRRERLSLRNARLFAGGSVAYATVLEASQQGEPPPEEDWVGVLSAMEQML